MHEIISYFKSKNWMLLLLWIPIYGFHLPLFQWKALKEISEKFEDIMSGHYWHISICSWGAESRSKSLVHINCIFHCNGGRLLPCSPYCQPVLQEEKLWGICCSFYAHIPYSHLHVALYLSPHPILYPPTWNYAHAPIWGNMHAHPRSSMAGCLGRTHLPVGKTSREERG